MNIRADLTSYRSLYLQTIFDGLAGRNEKTIAGSAKNASDAGGANIEIIFASRTEVTLQVKDFEKSLQNSEPQAQVAEPSEADFLSGYWGIEQTAARIADFVLTGAGDDAEKLRIGRDAIQKGFKEAEDIWGGTLPDISYKTIDAAVFAIDERLHQLEAPVVDVVA